MRRCLLIVSFALLPVFVEAQLPIDPAQTVNLATGEMQFNLPLGNVEGIGGNNYPITVNYHAGIRVTEAASPVGLGFSYGSGGISRKVVYVPDDNIGGAGSFSQDMSQFDHLDDHCEKPWWLALAVFFLGTLFIGLALAPMMDPISAFTVGFIAMQTWNVGAPLANALLFNPSDYIAGGSHSGTYNKNGNGKGFFRGASDDLPDIYNVNTPFICGELVWVGPYDPLQGGHFVFRQASGATIKDKETIKVIYTLSAETFEIVLANGTKLIFDKVQKSPGSYSKVFWQSNPTDRVECSADGNQKQIERIPASWLLTKVLYPDYIDGDGDRNPLTNPTLEKGSWLCFEYETVGPINARPLPEARQSDGWTSTITAFGSDPVAANSCILEEPYLRWVKTPNQSAEYVYNEGRKDDLWFRDSDMNLVAEARNQNPAASRIKSKNGIAQPVAARKVLNRIVTRNISGVTIQTITFNTDYSLRPQSFHSYSKNQDGDFYAFTDNPAAGCLTLKSILISSVNGVILPPTIFSYDKNLPSWEGTFSIGTPPKDGSNKMKFYAEQKDYWGYYKSNNGNVNNFNKDGDSAFALNTDSWSLNRISFGTGGSIEWQYESQRYDLANGLAVKGKNIGTNAYKATKYGGGVRVKNITVKDGISPQKLTQSYFYTSEIGNFVEIDGHSSGHATTEPIPYLELSENDLRPNGARGGLYTPAKVAYEMVQVVANYQPNADPTKNGTAPNGYTVYEFVTSVEHPNGGVYGDIDNSWKRGMIKSISTYSSNNKLVQSQTFDNDRVDLSSLTTTRGVTFLNKTTTTKNGVPIVKTYKYAPDIGANSPDYILEQRQVFNTSRITVPGTDPQPGCGDNAGEIFFERIGPSYCRAVAFGSKGIDIASLIFYKEEKNYWNGYGCGYFNSGFYVDVRLAHLPDVSDPFNCALQWSEATRVRLTSTSDEFFQTPPNGETANPVMLFNIVVAFNGRDLVVNYTLSRQFFEDQNKQITIPNYAQGSGNVTTSSSTCTLIPDPYWVQTGAFNINNNHNTIYVGMIDDALVLVNYANIDVPVDFDGQPNQIVAANSDGKMLVSIPKPAYWEITNYADMLTKHMLTQQCQSVAYYVPKGTPLPIDPASFKRNVVSASATKWAQFNGGQWLPSASFAWNATLSSTVAGQEPTTSVDFADFNHTNGASNPNWQLTGTIDKYNTNGGVLQTTNPVGVSSSVIYAKDNILPIASIANAKSAECFFTSFEDDAIAWSMVGSGNGTLERVQDKAKTGQWSGRIRNTSTASERYAESPWQSLAAPLPSSKKFTFSGWVYTTGPQPEIFIVTSSTTPPTIYQPGTFDAISLPTPVQTGRWIYLQKTFMVPQNTKHFLFRIDHNGATATGMTDVYFDDLKFYPSNSLMSCTYYDPLWRQPVLTVDANENPSKLAEFDSFGRPWKVWKVDKTKGSNEAEYKKTQILQKEYYLNGGLLSDENIRVISPNGGEKFQVGNDFLLEWINRDRGNIRVSFINADGSGENIFLDAPQQQGYASFHKIMPSSGQGIRKIKVLNMTKGYSDVSDNTFTVTIPLATPTTLSAVQRSQCSNTVDFSWTCIGGNNPTYNIYVDGNVIATGVTTTSFSKSFGVTFSNAPGSPHSWYVIANDDMTTTQSATGTLNFQYCSY